MNSKEKLNVHLQNLSLTKDEAKIYVELLGKPNTHLQLARQTGINRTKVYRIVDELIKRSLLTRRTDDRGMFLIANDPNALEIELTTSEEEVRRRRNVFEQLLPDLRAYHSQSASDRFAIQTYEGVEGFKQMQWHELATRGELLVFGNMTVEQLGIGHHWAEKFRMQSAEKGYIIREIFNRPHEKPDFTDNQEFMQLYKARIITENDLPMGTPMVIYNDTVAIYQFNDERRVGAEVINAAYAKTIRHIFEHYWQLGKDSA